jgi:hypothetical protein
MRHVSGRCSSYEVWETSKILRHLNGRTPGATDTGKAVSKLNSECVRVIPVRNDGRQNIALCHASFSCTFVSLKSHTIEPQFANTPLVFARMGPFHTMEERNRLDPFGWRGNIGCPISAYRPIDPAYHLASFFENMIMLCLTSIGLAKRNCPQLSWN